VFFVISDVSTAFDDDAMAARINDMNVVVLFCGMRAIDVVRMIPRIVVERKYFFFVDHLNSMGIMMVFVNTLVKAEIAMRVDIFCSVIAEFSWIFAQAKELLVHVARYPKKHAMKRYRLFGELSSYMVTFQLVVGSFSMFVGISWDLG
jgi:hypothetical protein